ncbi:NAD(P)/FAD-dependent oxidoreductase [Dyadobacter sandarakinus]|uniref:FAD-binding oxidoreductase n=1 Tax=Dyadobacter sandarakinus TaxID=2747268 RepID=A0ABX7IDC0_9BACT|nr:FAD-dependent oxidoreductase [Dyadobacter sandarakinus]QRR03929.1 FAD-binding oxidoreductase [Dyadobacter sandarakinus]
MSSDAAEFDYLIIGQGIGGTCLAWHLHRAGKSFRIVHDSTAPSSSRVAAGIFNPLTGKKLVKTWLADELFPYASRFYQDIERQLGVKFYYEMPVFRPFRSVEEQNSYIAQTAEPGIAPYVDAAKPPLAMREYVQSELGGLTVTRSGWVDLPVFLDHSKAFFEQSGCYTEGSFELTDLEVQPQKVLWKGNVFQKVIFSRGFFEVGNGFFDWLPFAPVKGQILEIETDMPSEPYIINQGIFMLPLDKHRSKAGATYSWDPLDWATTPEAREELEGKLRLLLRGRYRVTAQLAGVRPSVKDRRPLIGVHPEQDNICIFNGLGTKGVTLAPYFADQFVAHLEHGKELNPLVNIKRYFSLYFR